MIFMGSFFSADELSLSIYPSDTHDIKKITMEDTVLDTFYVTRDVQSTITKDIPSDWDLDTIMSATYDEDASASNVSWSLETTSHLIVKRKLADEFDWTTILVKEVHTLEDFEISDTDITPTSGKYVYAVVPILCGIEGSYALANVDVKVRQLTLTDSTGTWATIFTDGSCNTTNTTPGSFITTLNDKYPTYVTNTVANYQTVSVTGQFYPTNSYCDLDDIYDDAKRVKYIREFINFLTNRKAKVLKNVDGRQWLVMVDNGVADNMGNTYQLRDISFSCVEIGDVDDTETLTINGITNIPEEFWG